jgi:mannose/fructose/N-acetylgalactosamine-specific phosphotransferase system component IID
MKLTKKNLNPLLTVVILCTLGGSLAWFILEIIFSALGIPFSLSTGKIGFDLEIIAVYLNVNPGTVIGMTAGFFVFKAI